jgi:hypothetical protein
LPGEFARGLRRFGRKTLIGDDDLAVELDVKEKNALVITQRFFDRQRNDGFGVIHRLSVGSMPSAGDCFVGCRRGMLGAFGSGSRIGKRAASSHAGRLSGRIKPLCD